MERSTGQDGWTTISGHRHHHLRWGDSSNPALLLLHGGYSSARGTWRHTAPDFADHWSVHAPDHRGHGESAWSPDGDYSLGSYVNDLREFMAQTGLDAQDPLPVIGHSLGGYIAVSFAARYPELLGPVVLVDSLPRDFTPDHREVLRNRPVPQGTFATYAEAESAIGSRTPGTGRPRYGLVQHADGRWRRRTDVVGIHRALPLPDPDRERLWDDLHSLQMPVRLIRGEHGTVSVESADEMSALGVEVTTYDGAGHWVHRDDPGRFVEDVTSFLTG